MRSFGVPVLLCFSAIIALAVFSWGDDDVSLNSSKINGVNYVSSPEPMKPADAESVVNLGSNYIALIPYAFIPGRSTEVIFDAPQQWYGETIAGTIQMIKQSREKELKIMLKPHVWVKGDGWAGDFQLETEEEWLKWEKAYEKYILAYAKIADSLDVELFCFATEFRMVVRNRPSYFPKLIEKIRTVYDGKLTYAANWDNYDQVTFWNQLDYIGIDAYFPLCDERTPTVKSLKHLWLPYRNKLMQLALIEDKQILFTEFGYRSADYAAGKHWTFDRTTPLNLVAQRNAYEALFQTYWNEQWFAGGFLWKWFPNHSMAGGNKNNEFTPQNKPAEDIVTKYYRQYKN